MSKFTKSITRTYQFDGDTVVVTMARLKRKDALRLAPHISDPDEDGNVKMSFGDSMEFVEVSSDVLLGYVSSFSGLVDDQGTPITIEDVCGEDSEVYFMGLISDMMGDLMKASFIGEDKAKKSGAKPAETSKVSPLPMKEEDPCKLEESH